MPLGLEVGLGLGDFVLDGDPVPLKGAHPQFSAYVCCGQKAGWIKMQLGTEVGLGPGAWAEAYLRTKLHLDPSSLLATTDMDQKLGDCVPFWGRVGSPSNTKSPKPRPTSVPSGILIHPAIWPQQTWAENWGCAPPLFGEG